MICSGVAVATTSYLSNGLSRSFPADPDSVWLACQEALRLEGYFVRRLGSRERENNRILCFTTSAYEVLPRETRVWLEVGAPAADSLANVPLPGCRGPAGTQQEAGAGRQAAKSRG